jgi:hypothetical protein
VLASSGLIAGEGLAGVVIAFVLGYKAYYGDHPISAFLERIRFADESFARIAGPAGVVAGVALMAALCVFLYRAGRAAQADPAA